MLAVDADGCVFVNYLGDLELTEEEFDETRGVLREHRDFIQRQRAAGANLKVAAKYEWMASFHDWVVRDRIHADYIDDLLIDASRPPTMQRFRLGT